MERNNNARETDTCIISKTLFYKIEVTSSKGLYLPREIIYLKNNSQIGFLLSVGKGEDSHSWEMRLELYFATTVYSQFFSFTPCVICTLYWKEFCLRSTLSALMWWTFLWGFLFRPLHHGRHWHYRYYYGKHLYDYLFKIKFFDCFSFVVAAIQSSIPPWTVPWIVTSILAFQLSMSLPKTATSGFRNFQVPFCSPVVTALIHKVSDLFSILPPSIPLSLSVFRCPKQCLAQLWLNIYLLN